MVVVSEVALLVVLGVALLVIDPLTTAVAVAYFGGVALLLNRRLGVRARSAGRATAESNIAGRTVIQDAVDTYPEIAVMRRRGVFVERFAGERRRYAEAQATSMLLGAVPRYLMEAAMVLGAALMAATLALTNDLAGAVGGIVLFLAAASRVVPALLRLNSAVITMRNQAAAAQRAGDLAEQVRAGQERGGVEYVWGVAEEREVPYVGEKAAAPSPPRLNDAEAMVDAAAAATPTGADIALTDVSLRYPERDGFALADITLNVAAGQSLALVGPTGAGKSSLVAVILGLVEPTAGTVRVGGVAPATGAAEFAVVEPQSLPATDAAAVGYVPQDVALVFGTVRDNVALGIPEEAIDDAAVWAALQRAHLAEFVQTLPAQLNTVVGERGVRLSGGQRQRLGLARALYTPPRLLVLDEATPRPNARSPRRSARSAVR
jgi:ATP-binding cassette subfamily C protein